MYYMVRAANWTESQIDEEFSTLKNVPTIKILLLIIGLALGVAFLFLALV